MGRGKGREWGWGRAWVEWRRGGATAAEVLEAGRAAACGWQLGGLGADVRVAVRLGMGRKVLRAFGEEVRVTHFPF